MSDSKLINILRSFTPEEFRELEKFVASPYFSKGRDLMPLYKGLKPFYPEFKEDITVELLFSRIFPGKVFEGIKSYNIIKTLSSQLFKLCKDYMIQLELDDDKKGKEYYLLTRLRKNKMDKEFDKEFQNSLMEINDPGKGNVKDFIKNYLITSVQMDCNLDRDDFDNAFEKLLLKSEHIVAAALISCFKFEDEKNIAKAYNKELRFTLMSGMLEKLNVEELIGELEKKDAKFYPYIRIYYMIYRMNRHKESSQYYFETKALLEESFHLFGQFENHELWNTMLTYCNMKLFSHEDNLFRTELHELHKKMVTLNIHKRTEKEDLHIVLFRNIVITATPLKDYDWLEEFINKFSGELHIDHRSDMKNYSHAYLNFMKGEFEKALEYIMKVGYELFLYKHDVKMLQIRIYYELGYLEEALSLIDTLQHYLKNTNDLPEIHKSGFRNFLSKAKELCKIKYNDKVDLKEIEYFEHKLRSDTRYASTWILEKLDELKVKN